MLYSIIEIIDFCFLYFLAFLGRYVKSIFEDGFHFFGLYYIFWGEFDVFLADNIMWFWVDRGSGS